MLRSLKGISGYKIRRSGENIGKIKDFYFHDDDWAISYLVGDIGLGYWKRREVLIPPSDLWGSADDKNRTFHLLFGEQLNKNFITADMHKPLSKENLLTTLVNHKEDIRLRSANKTMGYHIQANDSEFGHVQDFIVDDKIWKIQFILVAVRNGWPGKEVLIPRNHIKRIDWQSGKIHVDLSKKNIIARPDIDEVVAGKFEVLK
ncbi:MAG: PRC-barrel domain-containing protein [Candidatus Omnitrophica bacterium]|nr:PRC-barrel domain-containing protein [Candidatus Omnitrophota bacterium]